MINSLTGNERRPYVHIIKIDEQIELGLIALQIKEGRLLHKKKRKIRLI